MLKRNQAGFTIIEVMIVVTIIGVLVAIVLPGFRLEAARAKVSEAILAATNCRTTISETYQVADVLPGAHNWGCESNVTSQYVQSVDTTDEGIILVTLSAGAGDARLASFTISLEPLNSAGAVVSEGDSIASWRCGKQGPSLTDLNPKYLPASCRGQ